MINEGSTCVAGLGAGAALEWLKRPTKTLFTLGTRFYVTEPNGS
jgi:hypothetical protein